MSSDQVGYVVLEYNQASGQPDIAGVGGLFDRSIADILADDYRKEAQAAGRGETFAVARVVTVEDPA